MPAFLCVLFSFCFNFSSSFLRLLFLRFLTGPDSILHPFSTFILLFQNFLFFLCLLVLCLSILHYHPHCLLLLRHVLLLLFFRPLPLLVFGLVLLFIFHLFLLLPLLTLPDIPLPPPPRPSSSSSSSFFLLLPVPPPPRLSSSSLCLSLHSLYLRRALTYPLPFHDLERIPLPPASPLPHPRAHAKVT